MKNIAIMRTSSILEFLFVHVSSFPLFKNQTFKILKTLDAMQYVPLHFLPVSQKPTKITRHHINWKLD